MLDLQSEEERRMREVVERRPLPGFFDGYDIEFGRDWSGGPSVTIWLAIDVRLATGADETDAVNRYVRETERELVGLRLSHLPVFGSGRRTGLAWPLVAGRPNANVFLMLLSRPLNSRRA